MRFGLKVKEAFAVSFVTFLAVTAATLLHLSELSRVELQEVIQQDELIAKQIYAQSSRALARGPRRTPLTALRRDQELRTLIEASVTYSPHLLYAVVVDRGGKVLLHSDQSRQGERAADRPGLQELLERNVLNRFLMLYTGPKIYEVVMPLTLDGEAFGSIKLGVASRLLREELESSAKKSLILAGAFLPIAWFVALGFANLARRPIRQLVQEIDRLRRGEFSSLTDATAQMEDEYKELASHLQLLGQELQSDRLKTLGGAGHFQQVVDQLEDAILFLNQERKILFCNRATQALLGKEIEGAIGQPLLELLDSADPLRHFLHQSFEDDTSVRNATVRLTKNGRTKQVLVSVFLMRDEGKLLGAVVLLKDTESIKTVQSLIHYSAKLAALGQLTSGIAHEVKNPLNAMAIHLELLRLQFQPSPPATRAVAGSAALAVAEAPASQALQHVEVIANEIRRLDEVVQGFLKFTRPEDLKLQPVSLAALFDEVVPIVQPEAKRSGVTLVVEHLGAPDVHGDPTMLRQAFLNLALNACQAMPNGGTLRIQCAAARGRRVLIAFADTGVGIKPEHLQRIFDLYFTTKEKGSGIGLSMVYRTVQMHDGDIEVQSTPGGGTTFRVFLPKA
jgi:PAS domain S-box-containing protein